MAPYKILKQGYMLKEPPPSKRGLRKKLHRYWFVLVEDKRQVALVYFKNEDSYISRQRNEGFIRLDDCEAISVVGEYLGSKHAFVVKTPRANYHLVPESRYDLHEWIFTLHNSLESFKKKQRKARERHGHRQRSNTVDSTFSRPSIGASGTTPPTPTRRAPPPPISGGGAVAAASRSPRRRPVRPAPIAPGGRNRHSQEGSFPMSPTIGHCVVETPPPGYSETMPAVLSQEGYGISTLGSVIHPVMDLDISQTEHDIIPQHREVVEIQPVHTRAASDSLILHHQNSASLPDLIKHEGSSSPDNTTEDQGSSLEDSGPGQQGALNQPLTFKESPRGHHTRHLSLISGHTRHLSLISGVGEVKPQSRRRKSKRSGSIKQRSRSPPNLPPPPPPGDLEENSDTTVTGMTSSSSDTTQQELHVVQPVSHELTASEPSNTSLGFSEVMNTISNIDEQLDMINDGRNPKPSVPVPQRTTESAFANGQLVNHVSENEMLNSYREEDEEGEWPTVDHTHLSMERTTPEGATNIETPATDHDLGPSPQMITDEQHQDISSPEAGDTATTSEAQHKSSKGKHRVMFKEEVEDIPSYDPQMDQPEEEEEEEIPSSVAALKQKLFGAQESEVARYKKDGILSPRHTHPENVTFSDVYEFHKESSPFYRENSPNANNNNSEDSPPESVEDRRLLELADVGIEERVREENVYDRPWDQMAASKYKVIGVRKRTGKKERTPPLPPSERAQSGEVMMSVVPQPGSTELRNVQSLERAHKSTHSYSLERRAKHEPSPPRTSSATDGDSLLASISTTLQACSRYGSDSFLASVEPVQPAKKRAQSEMRISSRGELEKIKTAHRRDAGSTSTAAAEPSPPSQSSPFHPSHNHSSPPHKPVKLAKPPAVSNCPKTAASMEELQKARETQVTYDANTQSHILRSLV